MNIADCRWREEMRAGQGAYFKSHAYPNVSGPLGLEDGSWESEKKKNRRNFLDNVGPAFY